MYYMATIEGTVRIPPYKFGENLEDVAIETLNEEYTGKLDKDSGLLVGVTDIEYIGEGVVIMGDGAAYHDVVFKALFFKPEQQEIVVGEVIEIAEFGAFVRIGPMDGLVHVSQITDDVTKFIERGSASLVVIAEDVDPAEIVAHIPVLAEEKEIPYVYLATKEKVGAAAGLSVGTASACIVDAGDAADLVAEVVEKVAELKE